MVPQTTYFIEMFCTIILTMRNIFLVLVVVIAAVRGQGTVFRVNLFRLRTCNPRNPIHALLVGVEENTRWPFFVSFLSLSFSAGDKTWTRILHCEGRSSVDRLDFDAETVKKLVRECWKGGEEKRDINLHTATSPLLSSSKNVHFGHLYHSDANRVVGRGQMRLLDTRPPILSMLT